MCVTACPTGARRNSLYEVTVEETISFLESQVIFFEQSGGGVTYSGGECTFQTEFLCALSRKLYDMGISQVMETSGYFDLDTVRPVLERMDLLFIDIKLMDREKHKYYTGVDNASILENIKLLGAALAALLEPQRRKQRFVLYQLQLDEENAIPFAFKDITALKAAGYEQPPAAMYYVAGSGEIYCPAEESDDTLLKRLFADCRERLPEGCRGRPMAVSDVVELNHGAKRAYYYVSGQDQFRQVKFSPMLAKKEIPEKTQERF